MAALRENMPNRTLEDLLPEGNIKSAGRDLNIRGAWTEYVLNYQEKGQNPPLSYQEFKKIYETTGEAP